MTRTQVRGLLGDVAALSRRAMEHTDCNELDVAAAYTKRALEDLIAARRAIYALRKETK